MCTFATCRATIIAMSKPTLYLMLGYPGAGKTTAAKIIADITGATHLWADLERRRRYGQPTYAHQENLHLYGILNEETAQLLNQRQSVVFDTGFNYFRDREHLRQVADNCGANCVLVWVTTHKEISKGRATTDSHLQETRVLGDFSEEDFERISENMEPPRSDEAYISLDGTKLTPAYVATQLNIPL